MRQPPIKTMIAEIQCDNGEVGADPEDSKQAHRCEEVSTRAKVQIANHMQRVVRGSGSKQSGTEAET